MRIELFADRKKRWRFRLRARNNEIWSSSQSYATKSNARRAARAFVNSAAAGIEITEDGETIAQTATADDQAMHAVTIEQQTYPTGTVTGPGGPAVHVPVGVILDGGTSLCIPQGSTVAVNHTMGGGTEVSLTLLATTVEYSEQQPIQSTEGSA